MVMSPCDDENAAWIAQRVKARTHLDLVLFVLAIGFALVLACVPIRNSDLWIHLAAGRHLVTGPSSAGADPFSHTATETGRASSSWLFDVLGYGVYSIAGSSGLGAFKAFVVALLAAALLWGGWRTAGGWVGVTCTILALLAITPWLHMQPMLLSLLFFAMALWYLERRTAPCAEGLEKAPANTWTSFWPLYVLFAVWVNVDSWFLLGPLALGCYWLGGLYPLGRVRRGRVPIVAVFVGLLVCLASPHWFHALRVPDELAFPVQYPWLAEDGPFRYLFLSPLDWDFYDAGPGRGVVGLAMAVLAALGIVVLLLNRAGQHGPRLLVCAGLLALSLYQARNIPLFAVALAALVPRAWQEFAAVRFRDRPGAELRLRQAVTARFAMAILGLALIALAWLGHLQAGRPEPRTLGIATDPSLVRAAEEMAAWRREGKIAERSLGFNYSPDIANYFAWFCPEEKGFFDSRLDACAGAAPDFNLVRQGLSGAAVATPNPAGHTAPPLAGWREVLRRRGVDHIVLADRDRERTQAVLKYVLAAPEEWQVLFQSGRVLVLGWRDRAARGTRTAAWPGRDLNHDGLHPADSEKAPAAGPDRPPDPPWWQLFVPPTDRPSLDREEAALRMMIFEALRVPTSRSAAREWQLALAAAAVGQAVTGDPTGAALRVGWLPVGGSAAPGLAGLTAQSPMSERLQATYLALRDEAPPGQLWAAIRACRRALLADPQDAEAYLLLGQLYCRLAWNTAERTWEFRLPALSQLRKQQAIGALKHALHLKPELDQAHGLLISLYREIGIADLTLQHLQELHKLQRERGPERAESPSQFTERVDRLATNATQLEQELFSLENTYERKQAGLSLADRARLAQRLGQVDRALNLLHAADATAFGAAELQVALELLLWAGRADEGRQWLKPQHKDLLGEFGYHWLGARLSAATGDYAGADAHLGKLMVRSTIVSELGSRPIDLEIALSIVIGEMVLGGPRLAISSHVLLSVNELEPQLAFQTLALTIERTAEFSIVQGAMALERGDAGRAEHCFRQAMVLTQHHARRPGHSDADRSAHPIAAYYLRLLASSPKER